MLVKEDYAVQKSASFQQTLLRVCAESEEVAETSSEHMS